jgi:hypothetical protein
MSMLKVCYRQLSQIDQFSAYMRRLSDLVNSETSSAYRHNKSQNLQQKCGTWDITYYAYKVYMLPLF